jgi:hypothetical protein
MLLFDKWADCALLTSAVRIIFFCSFVSVKVVTGRDVASEKWSSPETDRLGFSLYAAPSHNHCPVFQNHMRYYYEDPEESSEENSVTKGPDWRQKTERES